jgi:hypothetical protein
MRGIRIAAALAVLALVAPAPDGKITAERIQVSKDGVKPPQ